MNWSFNSQGLTIIFRLNVAPERPKMALLFLTHPGATQSSRSQPMAHSRATTISAPSQQKTTWLRKEVCFTKENEARADSWLNSTFSSAKTRRSRARERSNAFPTLASSLLRRMQTTEQLASQKWKNKRNNFAHWNEMKSFLVISVWN